MTMTGRQRRISSSQTNNNNLLQVLILLVVAISHCNSEAKSLLRRPKQHSSPEASPVSERQLLGNVENRVVGGQTVTDLDKHPFFAEWHGQFCGGALIHDDLVLTAAHCDNANSIAKDIYFRNVRRKQDGSVHREIIDRISHPNYNAEYSTRDYDYLILKLDSSALIDEFGNPTGVQIIDINTNASIPATNDSLWGIGYGQLGEDVPGMSNTLQEATIYAFSNQTCENQYVQYFEAEYMFCSGVKGGGIDTCQGDSGGPIIHQATNTLVGVVSFGIGCAREKHAGVNARVSAVHEWLERAMCDWSNYPLCSGTYSPTPAPGPGNNGNGNAFGNGGATGSITVNFQYDEYPEEVAWTLLEDRMDGSTVNELYFQPWETITKINATTSDQFDNLQQGFTYHFKLADSEGDGVCCNYGRGDIHVYDNVKGADLWHSSGNFGPYYEIAFDILPNGNARLTDRSNHYSPSTWTQFETMMAPVDEPAWPGAMPVLANESVVTVNVDTDDYPEEISWELHWESNNHTQGWVLVKEWNGTNAGFRSLVSTEVTSLSRGWYRFVVRDSEGDGICCEYGRGYVSLTGPLSVSNGNKGLVWGNDGQYWGMDRVFFHVDNSGYISVTSMSEATISRTIDTRTKVQTKSGPPPP